MAVVVVIKPSSSPPITVTSLAPSGEGTVAVAGLGVAAVVVAEEEEGALLCPAIVVVVVAVSGGGIGGGGSVLGLHCSAHRSVSFKASWKARGVLRT